MDNKANLKITRDEFSPAVKDSLAKQSGFICAYPDCKRLTVAKSADRISGITLTGVAAHITAASPNGPRYDIDLTSEERASERNGIWLCQNHAKHIDDNPTNCSAKTLRRWKSQHEDWVFRRVESGKELFNEGTVRVSVANVGAFDGSYDIPLARHNIIVGDNDSGKTSLCEVISAFAGEPHWSNFDKRFSFSKNADQRKFIAAYHNSEQHPASVRLSCQLDYPAAKLVNPNRHHIHVEVNGCPSVDWPRSLFKVVYIKDQLYRSGRGRNPKNTFIKAIGYLSSVFGITEDLIWDALRDELFVSSVFGYRFKRISKRRVDARVPDGRTFYLPANVDHLSFTELHLAFIDIAVKFMQNSTKNDRWMLILDDAVFSQLDTKKKVKVFKTLTDLDDTKFQTVFCLHSENDSQLLREVRLEKWVNATRLGQLTVHSFL